MTVQDRLLRARKDLVKVRESIPNSRANLSTVDSLTKAEVEVNHAIFYANGEQLNTPC